MNKLLRVTLISYFRGNAGDGKSGLPPDTGWEWCWAEDTPSAGAPRPETFRLGRWTPAGRDHSSKHPTETESTSPEPSAYWSKLVTLGPTANTSERAGARETDRQGGTDRERDRTDTQTGLCCVSWSTLRSALAPCARVTVCCRSGIPIRTTMLFPEGGSSPSSSLATAEPVGLPLVTACCRGRSCLVSAVGLRGMWLEVGGKPLFIYLQLEMNTCWQKYKWKGIGMLKTKVKKLKYHKYKITKSGEINIFPNKFFFFNVKQQKLQVCVCLLNFWLKYVCFLFSG